ncbi:MAG: site-specific integrase [Gammaproteobacteria bacterium]|nr:site-specific integrase [Gammaproteobacteria bacterium]
MRDCNAAQHLFPVFTEKLLCDIDPVDIRQYVRMRETEGAAASTINKEIGLLSRAIHYANREWGYALYNPALGCKKREPEGRVRWLTRQEAQRLIDCAGQLGPRAAHLPELITLAVHTGMRKGELLSLEWRRVDFAHGLIYLEASHTKSSKRRSIPLNQPAKTALTACRERAPGRYVFGGVKDVKRSFAHACRLAGIDNFRFHDLRHTFASWLVQAGAALAEVRDLLGHSSIEMTERYAHLAPERLRGAVARLEGA